MTLVVLTSRQNYQSENLSFDNFNIQAGGIMAGMSRDKCGAASAAGRYKFKSQYIVTFPISHISIRLSQYPFTAHPNYGICQPHKNFE